MTIDSDLCCATASIWLPSAAPYLSVPAVRRGSNVSGRLDLRQWVWRAGRKSHWLDCQLEMTPLSPQLGQLQAIRSSAPSRYWILPGQGRRCGRRRQRMHEGVPWKPWIVAAATMAVMCCARRRPGPVRSRLRPPVSSIKCVRSVTHVLPMILRILTRSVALAARRTWASVARAASNEESPWSADRIRRVHHSCAVGRPMRGEHGNQRPGHQRQLRNPPHGSGKALSGPGDKARAS